MAGEAVTPQQRRRSLLVELSHGDASYDETHDQRQYRSKEPTERNAMTSIKYIGMDVDTESTSIAVRNCVG